MRRLRRTQLDSAGEEEEEETAEESTASARSGEAPNGANSTATATPPRWSLQGLGLVSIRNLGEEREGECGQGSGFLLSTRAWRRQSWSGGDAVGRARVATAAIYREEDDEPFTDNPLALILLF